MPQHRHKFAFPYGDIHILQHQRQAGLFLVTEGDMLGFDQLFQNAFLAFFVVLVPAMPCGTAAALAPLLQGAGTRAAGPAVLRTAEAGFARLPAQRAGGLRPALPLFYSLLCHTAVEPQGRGQPVAFTGSPISEEKVVPFPANRRLTVVFRMYSITLGLNPVV